MKFDIFFLLALLAGLVVVEKASAGSMILNWHASVSPRVAGYNVYFGTTPDKYPYKINTGNVTTITISNLSNGGVYYFAATAYDTGGKESCHSAAIKATVPTPPAPVAPPPRPAIVSTAPAGGFSITRAAAPHSPASIRFAVSRGHRYEVQATTNLRNWSSIWQSSVAVSSDGVMEVTDPDSKLFASRFYRLVLH
jgi:hypothetical protein